MQDHHRQRPVIEGYESCFTLKEGINTCQSVPDVLYNGESGRQGLINYLSSVYPLARNRLETMPTRDLDVFYNSLWFYYNCSYSGTAIISSTRDVIVGSSTKKVSVSEQVCWTGICDSKYGAIQSPVPRSMSPPPTGAPVLASIVRLPYSPTGLFYSWHEWNRDRVPMIITTCSSSDVSLLGGSIPGQTFISGSMGPAPVWQYARAAYRNIYSPIDDIKDRVPKVLKGSHDRLKPPFPWGGPTSYPNPYYTGKCWNWWHGKASSRASPGYIEVSAGSEPGIAASVCPLWFDGWCGSGVFLHLGDTHIARNKTNAVYTLACRVNDKKTWGPDHPPDWGNDRLRQWFGSAKPITILTNIFMCHSGTPGGDSTSPKFGWNDRKIAVDICTPGSQELNSMELPSQNANDTLTRNESSKRDWDGKVSVNNYHKWCGKSRPIESCIGEAMYGGSYGADRINTATVWDEPIFILASLLEIDTVQMVMSANKSGYWQYEIADMRGSGVIQNPTAKESERIAEILDRDYSGFIEYDGSSNTNQKMAPVRDGYLYNTSQLKYKASFLEEFMPKVGERLSLRDPFDPDRGPESGCTTGRWSDNSQGTGDVMPNVSPEWEGNKTVNLTCQENASRMFANLALAGCKPTCGKDTKC